MPGTGVEPAQGINLTRPSTYSIGLFLSFLIPLTGARLPNTPIFYHTSELIFTGRGNNIYIVYKDVTDRTSLDHFLDHQGSGEADGDSFSYAPEIPYL
jgi:hypothetical protein